MSLVEKVDKYIRRGEETSKVELKSEIDVSSRSGAARFAKEVMAIANTRGYNGYIIIGVIDRRNRKSDDPKDYVCGFEAKDPDQLQRRMLEILHNYSDPVPEIQYEEVKHPSVGRKIGIVSIPYSLRRPHFVARDGSEIRQGEVWIRRGTAVTLATRSDQEEMHHEARTPPLVIINFSHPLIDAQRSKIEELTGSHMEDLIEIMPQFNDQESFETQVKRFVEENILFSSEEWQILPLLIIPPEFAPIACVLLAYLHGKMGYFPQILRRRPSGRGQPYEVAELTDLRRIREIGRGER